MIHEIAMTERPDRIIIIARDLTDSLAMEIVANEAVEIAKRITPKITGHLASTYVPVFGQNFFGIHFPDKRSWFLEKGTNPFTMKSLAGKTIPMWVDDPDGSVAKEEGPKTQTRITVDGRRQAKIFRKAAPIGSRKMVFRNGTWVSVPRSYPGAPGRIGNPRAAGGRIAAGNVGVRWRHPGIGGRDYLNRSMELAAYEFGIPADRCYLIDAATYPIATKA